VRAGMRANLDLTHGLILAEAVMMAAAPVLGRRHAHDAVYDACRKAIEGGGDLADISILRCSAAPPIALANCTTVSIFAACHRATRCTLLTRSRCAKVLSSDLFADAKVRLSKRPK
jgi:hypothetical protein